MLLYKTVQIRPRVCHASVPIVLFCSSAKTMQVDDSTVRKVFYVEMYSLRAVGLIYANETDHAIGKRGGMIGCNMQLCDY